MSRNGRNAKLLSYRADLVDGGGEHVEEVCKLGAGEELVHCGPVLKPNKWTTDTSHTRDCGSILDQIAWQRERENLLDSVLWYCPIFVLLHY